MTAVSEFLSFMLSTREGGGVRHRDSWERRLKAVCERNWWPFLSGCWRPRGLFVVMHSYFPPAGYGFHCGNTM